MTETPPEKRFAILCEIVRAQHFAWREAVAEVCPGVDPAAVTLRMWEITGRRTAESYAKRIDPGEPLAEPLAEQVAHSIAWSSRCMGEEVSVEVGSGGDEAFVRHTHCPWLDWHERMGLEAEDRPGCDQWFASTVAHLNEHLGADLSGRELRFETLEAMPDGDSCCLRRFWVQE